ncbi:uncharacterized protein LOC126965838 isoform X2 [Leptidea sinapis]|uniref:uncharacterized protein LOC126965838 isoform X2 n=1 Tax=Leptidea sinapis TaxID=189913 RepID=UPI0021C2CAC5|nr:uncharacterized protein LOC126965838 isoform X2 [Leptidea sinapis]
MDSHSRSASPREASRPQHRPPSPPASPAGFDNRAYQHDEADPNHNDSFTSTVHQNGHSKEPNGDTKTLEAVNLELINLTPKNGAKKKDVEVDMNATNPYDEYFVPVNEHRKYMRGEKLYVTADKRGEKGGCKRPLCWTLLGLLVAVIVALIVLAATGILFSNTPTPLEQYNVSVSSARAFGGIGNIDSEQANPDHTDHVHDHTGHNHDHMHDAKEHSDHDDHNDVTTMAAERTQEQNDDDQEHLVMSDESSDVNMYVPRTVEGELRIDNEDFVPALQDTESEKYREFTAIFNDALKRAILENIDTSDNDVTLEVIEIRNGSVIVTYRINWTPKYNSELKEELFTANLLKRNLDIYLSKNNRMISIYHVAEGSVNARPVLDMCKINNYNCEHSCEFDETILEFMCTCPTGQMIDIKYPKRCLSVSETPETNNDNRQTSASVDTNSMESSETEKPNTELPQVVNKFDWKEIKYVPTTTTESEEVNFSHIFGHPNEDHEETETLKPEPATTSSQDTYSGLGSDPRPVPTSEPGPQPEPTAEPNQETIAESSYELQSAVGDSSESKLSSNPKPEPEPSAEPKPEPQPTAEPIPEPTAEPKPEPQPSAEPIPEPTAQPNPELESTTKPYSDPPSSEVQSSEPNSEPEPSTKSNSELLPLGERFPEPEPSAEPSLEPFTTSDSKTEPRPMSEPNSEPELSRKDLNQIPEYNAMPSSAEQSNIPSTALPKSGLQEDFTTSSQLFENIEPSFQELHEVSQTKNIPDTNTVSSLSKEWSQNDFNLAVIGSDPKKTSSEGQTTEENMYPENTKSVTSPDAAVNQNEFYSNESNGNKNPSIFIDTTDQTPTTTENLFYGSLDLEVSTKADVQNVALPVNPLKEFNNANNRYDENVSTTAKNSNSKTEIINSTVTDHEAEVIPILTNKNVEPTTESSANDATTVSDWISADMSTSNPPQIYLNKEMFATKNLQPYILTESRASKSIDDNNFDVTTESSDQMDGDDITFELLHKQDSAMYKPQQDNSFKDQSTITVPPEIDHFQNVILNETGLLINNSVQPMIDKIENDTTHLEPDTPATVSSKSGDQSEKTTVLNEVATNFSIQKDYKMSNLSYDLIQLLEKNNSTESVPNKTIISENNITNENPDITFDGISRFYNNTSNSMENESSGKETTTEVNNNYTFEVTESDWLAAPITEINYEEIMKKSSSLETTETSITKLDDLLNKDDFEPDYLSMSTNNNKTDQEEPLYGMAHDYDSDDPRIKRVNTDYVNNINVSNTILNTTETSLFMNNNVPFQTTTIGDYIYKSTTKETVQQPGTSPIVLNETNNEMVTDSILSTTERNISDSGEEVINKTIPNIEKTAISSLNDSNSSTSSTLNENNRNNESNVNNLKVTIYEIPNQNTNQTSILSKTQASHSIEYDDHETEMNPFLPEIENNKVLVKKLQEGHDIEPNNLNETQNENTEEHSFINSEPKVDTEVTITEKQYSNTTETPEKIEPTTEEDTFKELLMNTPQKDSSMINQNAINIINNTKQETDAVLPISSFLLDTDDLDTSKTLSKPSSPDNDVNDESPTEYLSVVPINEKDSVKKIYKSENLQELNSISDSPKKSDRRTIESVISTDSLSNNEA